MIRITYTVLTQNGLVWVRGDDDEVYYAQRLSLKGTLIYYIIVYIQIDYATQRALNLSLVAPDQSNRT